MRTLTRTSAEWLATVYIPRPPGPDTGRAAASDTSTLLRNGAVMVVGIVIVVGVLAVTRAVLPA